MDYKDFENDCFPKSGERSRVEYYKCFYDPSKLEPITGQELLDLESRGELTDEMRSVWLFFYRPYNYGKIIGKVQRESIERLEREVCTLDEKKSLNILLLWLGFFAGVLLFFFTLGSMGMYLAGIPLFYSFTRYYENDGIFKKIFKKKMIIDDLSAEIDCLLNQQREMLEARLEKDEIENKFWGDVVEIEDNYLKDAGELATVIPDFYKNVTDISGEYFFGAKPQYPVVLSWGLLQSSLKSNSDISSRQRTGLKLASEDIKGNISTWRSVGGDKPMFRLWYIQFLFFHNKNLSLMSFYYDLITEKSYSEQIETYQYNHITNYSYNDEDLHYMRRDPVIKKRKHKIPEGLTTHIFGNKVKTISLSSASGMNYRCVIPDSEVKDGMNRWLMLRAEKMTEDLEGADLDSEQLKINIQKEIFSKNEQKKSLIDTLAWLSFKELRKKVAQFALIDEFERDGVNPLENDDRVNESDPFH